jgi:GTP-binding protein LepA
VLLIDAAQGVEAQTVANAHLAFAQDLKVIPVINKIDLPSANLELCTRQLEDILDDSGGGGHPGERQGGHRHRRHSGSGREAGAAAALVRRIRRPAALVFDSLYDSYRGVISYARVFPARSRLATKCSCMSNGVKSEVKEVGVFTPKMEKIRGTAGR